MATTVMNAQGRVTIPADIRQRLKIKKGDRLLIAVHQDAIILQTPADYFEAVAGVLKSKKRLTQALLRERAKDNTRENRQPLYCE
jgi:AbrB family looped-hinge helix DNA binding protein